MNRNIYCKLGPILAELKSLKGKDYNFTNFANRVGISTTTLSQLVNNKSLPRFDIAYIIARELNKSIEEIWLWVEE